MSVIEEMLNKFKEENPIAYKFWDRKSKEHFSKPLTELNLEECEKLYKTVTYLWKQEFEKALDDTRKRIMGL